MRTPLTTVLFELAAMQNQLPADEKISRAYGTINREIARANNIPLVSAPPLCRALFHSTKLDQEIPEGLFVAVAQVLAYVMQLKSWRAGNGRRPKPLAQELPIPVELRR